MPQGRQLCRRHRAAQDQSVAWTTYLAVEDADKTAGKITEAGGRVLADPFDVGDFGRMTVATDPAGASFGIWQAGRHIGVELANEHAALSWNEQLSPDLDGSKRFYSTVFGYTYEDIPSADPYVILKADGRSVGGMGLEHVPACWQTYFEVADTDATVLRVGELGGTLIRPAADTPHGRIAVVADDQGATFAVIEDTSES